MKNIEIPIKMVEEASKQHYDYGNESYVLKTKHNTLYKVFKETNPEILENKFQKLKKIVSKNIDFFTNPISTLSSEGNFVGYEMAFDEAYLPWWKSALRPEEKVRALYELKEKLLILESLGITYGDIKDDNILVNAHSRNLRFCDIDNTAVDDYEMDLLQPVLKVTNIKDSSSVHAIMHNFFTLDQLECPGLYYEDVLYMLDRYELINIPNSGYEVLLEMFKLQKNQKQKVYSNRYLIDKFRQIR